MGYSTILDIMGSTMIGGLLLLILFRMNSAASDNAIRHTGNLIMQEELVNVVNIIEHDFRKIGYCEDYLQIPNTRNSILVADSSTFSFLTDIPVSENEPGDGVVDTITYTISDTTVLDNTPNPNDKVLYRQINGGVLSGISIGMTKFKLSYHDSFGQVIATPVISANLSQILMIQIDLEIQDPLELAPEDAIDYRYSNVVWRQIRLAAKNLTNR